MTHLVIGILMLFSSMVLMASGSVSLRNEAALAQAQKEMDELAAQIQKMKSIPVRPAPPSVAPDGKTPVLIGGDWRPMADHPEDWVLLDTDNEGNYRFVYSKREEYEIPARKSWSHIHVTLEPPEWLRKEMQK